MSLTNNLVAAPVMATTAHRKRYNVPTSEIAGGGAFTTVDIVLDTYAPGSVMMANRIKHTAAVVGASVSASTARLYWGPSGSLSALGAGALDIIAAPGSTDGTHSITGVTPVAGDLESDNLLVMRITSTGANLSVVTAGAVSAVVEVVELGL